MLARPAKERVVYVFRRVDVVGGQLVLELLHEGLILFRFFALHLAPEGRLRFLVAQLQPGGIEARQRDIKAGSLQRDHFPAQDLGVGAAFGQQVVGVHKGPALRLAQVVDHHAGEVLVAALPGRQDAAVAIDQVAVGRDSGGHDPLELVKAADQLGDLLRRVQLGVALVGD